MPTTNLDNSHNLRSKDGVTPSYTIDNFPIVSTSHVVIEKESDFPVQDPTSITLESKKIYFIGADFTTAKFFNVEDGAAYTSGNIFGFGTTYTGTTPMFVGSDVSFDINNTNLSAPNASQIFDFTQTSPALQKIFVMDTVQLLNSKKFGTFDGMGSVDIINSNGLLIDDGITLAGSDQVVFSLDKFLLLSANTGFVGVDFASTVQQNLNITTASFLAPSGAVGLSGLTASGNVSTGFIASVSGTSFANVDGSPGGITPLSGISETDIRWDFQGNSGISDSSIAGNTFLTASRTTPITTLGVFEQIGGTDWDSTVAERFTTTTGGVLTYTPERNTKALIIVSATLSKGAGGSDELALRIAVDGVTNSSTQVTTDNNAPTAVTTSLLVEISEGTEIDAYVANLDTTTDVVVSSCTINVINGF